MSIKLTCLYLCIIKNENAMKTIEKMNKLELSTLLKELNYELYFKINPRMATTKNFRVIVKKELTKKGVRLGNAH